MSNQIFKKSGVLLFQVLLACLMLFFQNCSQNYSNVILQLDSGKLYGGTGNGEGYSGKPDRFIQIVPGFQCEGKNSPAAEIVWNRLGKAELIRHRNDKCEVSRTLIENVDSSNYNLDILGYREGIFERVPIETNSIPYDQYVESWCRPDQENQDSFDVLVQFNSKTQSANFRYYYWDNLGNSQMSLPVNVDNRFSDPNGINYQSPQFSLKIDRSQPVASAWWFFPADFSGVVNGKLKKQKLTCRVATGKILGLMQKLYPLSGQWNEYVEKSLPNTNEFMQPDKPCRSDSLQNNPSLARAECIHGGEKMQVNTDFNDCDGLTLRDQLNAFEWLCMINEGKARFVTARLRPLLGLKDLIQNLPENGLTWKPEWIQIFKKDRLVYESEPQSWWTNPIHPLPDSSQSAITLDQNLESTPPIYVLTKSQTSMGLRITASHLALVSLPGAELKADPLLNQNCQLLGQVGIFASKDPTCFIIIRDNSFIWFELDLNGQNVDLNLTPNSPTLLLYLTDSNFTSIHNNRLRNNRNINKNHFGIFLWKTKNLSLRNFELTNLDRPLHSYMDNNESIYSEGLVQNSYLGLTISGWNWNNVLKNIETKNIQGPGLSMISSPGAILTGLNLNENLGTPGFIFQPLGTQFKLLMNLVYQSAANQLISNEPPGLDPGASLYGTLDRVINLPFSESSMLIKSGSNVSLEMKCEEMKLDFLLGNSTELPVLRQALEILEDGRGNENGLCEPKEACEYHPEVGAKLNYYDPDTSTTCHILNGTFMGTDIRGIQ